VGSIFENRNKNAQQNFLEPVACTLTRVLALQERQKNQQAAQGQGEGSKGTDESQPGKPADGWGDTMPLFKDLALDGEQWGSGASKGGAAVCMQVLALAACSKG
jgi:hypothetical protein